MDAADLCAPAAEGGAAAMAVEGESEGEEAPPPPAPRRGASGKRPVRKSRRSGA